MSPVKRTKDENVWTNGKQTLIDFLNFLFFINNPSKI